MADDLEPSELSYDSRLDAFELYHLIVENAGHASSRDDGPILPALGHAISGSAATATTKALLYPLDLVIARLQVQKQLRRPDSKHPEYQGILDAASKIYQHEGGIRAFYTGCLPDVTKGIADSFLFFLAYTFLQERAKRRAAARKQQISVVGEMGIGIVAGSVAKLFTTPLQNICTRLQTAALLNAGDTEKDSALKQGDALTVSQVASQIYRERGLQGFWAGYSLSLILTTNPAITFAVDKFLHKLSPWGEAGSTLTFLIAAVSKAVATSITYPVSVAKSRAQATPHSKTSAVEGTDKTRHASPQSKLAQLFSAQYAVLLSLQKIYKQDGLPGLYSGLEGEVIKGFLSHGLTMMVKDRVHHSIITLYYLLLKITRQWPADLAKAQAITASVVVDARRRVTNLAENAVEGGKQATHNATEATSDLVESGKKVIGKAQERAENIGVTVAEGAKHAAGDAKDYALSAVDAGKDVAGEVQQRAANIGTTVFEAGKKAATNAPQNATEAVSSIVDEGKNAAGNVYQGAGNAATTLSESAKATAGDVSSRADNISTTVTEAGKSALNDVKDRALEGAKSAVDKVRGSS